MKGVVGAYTHNELIDKTIFYLLYGVQHRGQDTTGLTSGGDAGLRTWKSIGLVSSVYDNQFWGAFPHPADYVAIGVVSDDDPEKNIEPTPYEGLKTEKYEVSFALDGFLSHDAVVQESLFAFVLEGELSKNPDSFDAALEATMREFDKGYYSLVMSVYDKKDKVSRLYAARDCRGIRPLYMAVGDSEVFIASESAPIGLMKFHGVEIAEEKNITPGSVIKVSKDGLEEMQLFEPRPEHCIFEWVYFARPDSVIEKQCVHMFRKRLGHALVKRYNLRELYKVDDWENQNRVLGAVPYSGRSVTDGLSEAMGVPSDEVIYKNEYLGRTFLRKNLEFRHKSSDLKHAIIVETVQGKKVSIGDDSIVRGTVSESIAKNLRNAGAEEVDFLVSYGPIVKHCHSEPSTTHLPASDYKGLPIEEIGMGVASHLPSIKRVMYNHPDDVIDATGLRGKLCTMCMTEENPFDEK